MSLHFYSPRAYRFIREKFNKNLPHEVTIRIWYRSSTIDSGPGIGSHALKILTDKAEDLRSKGKQLICALIFDEMAVRKNIEWCQKTKKFIGYVNNNVSAEDDDDNNTDESALVSQAIVFMLSGINSFFQLPIAYFFINSLDSYGRQDYLNQILFELSKCDVDIGAVTFDGLAANISMCELFGAKFNDELKPVFENPYNGSPIHVILDPSHAQKLVRNNLASRGILYDDQNKKIEWQHIVSLERFSRDNNFGLVHKLNKKHINFQDRKMNVRISVQTLSKSVADSLQFLMDRRIPEFEDVSATIRFIRIFDTLFDIMNSTRIRGDDDMIYKSAINCNNKVEIMSFLQDAQSYIRSLKVANKQTGHKTLVIKSRIKTGFRGFMINIISIIDMYQKYVEEMHSMHSFSTYRLSQDHIEMFFGKIRSRNGCNDNPTVKQFVSSYRMLLHDVDVIISARSNCMQICHSDTLTISSRTQRGKNEPNGISNTETFDLELETDFYEMEQYANDNHLIEQVNLAGIAHIASIIEHRLFSCGQIHCSFCALVFSENEKVDNTIHISTNKRRACKSTFQICKVANDGMKKFLGKTTVNHFNDKICVYVLTQLDHTQIFPTFFEPNHDESHKYFFIKYIVNEFIHIKCTYAARKQTLDSHKEYFRKKLLKNVHFYGQ